MKKLTSEAELAKLIQEKCVLLFSANWCPDCRFIEPFMPEVEAEFPEYKFIYIDRDEFLDVCIAHDITGIPSFIVYDQGEIKGSFVSKFRKTKEEIINFLHNSK